jgi:hypothetical protein
MDMQRFVFPSRALVLAALLAASPASLAAEASGARTTARDISRKADDTAQAVKSYTVQQRDEAIKSAKSALDDLDARLRSLDRKVDREWDKMDQAARKKARAAQGALRRERDDVAEWYGGLKHGSAESWEEVKDGFVKSYEALKKSFVKARKQL